MASTDWQSEMDNMHTVFNRQATHSLGVIKAMFNQSGLSFTPKFEQHFIKTSSNR